MMFGIASALNGAAAGSWLAWLGVIVLLVMIFGWFGTVIGESVSGIYNNQVDRSFRMGMTWFIISEVMFFAAFFGALFYARQFALPWLGGEGNNFFTNMLLWPGFETTWPTNGPGEIGGDFEAMAPLGSAGPEHGDPAHQWRHDHHRPPCAEGQQARLAGVRPVRYLVSRFSVCGSAGL